ncbi:MAG: efflux RND transporter periplasmic adaptor subunit [Candidatus Eremiobacteraeota bacterium]|nr:efflux RND transporter periplasmic adaptor subunit [Candidatus Eremiobacteraeota bacterium]
MKNKRTRNLLILVGAIAVLIVAAVVAKGGGSHSTAVPMKTLAYTTFTVKLPENGVVQHERTETIPVLISGNIGHMYVQAGSSVADGELLATIYNPTVAYDAAGSQADYSSAAANVAAARTQEQNARVGYQAQVDTNKSTLDEAQRIYNADVQLYDNKAIPRQQLDQDKAKLDQARVAYEQSVEQARLGAVSGYNGSSVQSAIAAAEKARIVNEQNQEQAAFSNVRAPFSGVIQTVTSQPNDPLRPLQAGDAVTAGQALFTIAGGNGYIVRAQVDEQDAIDVRVGLPVLVTGQDFPGKTIHGRVEYIAPVATKSTDASSTAKQVLTTIALDSSPAFLRDGMSADVDILTTNVPHALVVPNDAIVKDGGKSYVFVVTNGKAQKRPIVTGRAADAQTLVRSGLSAGDKIVTQPPPGFQDGTAVTAASPSPSPTAS